MEDVAICQPYIAIAVDGRLAHASRRSPMDVDHAQRPNLPCRSVDDSKLPFASDDDPPANIHRHALGIRQRGGRKRPIHTAGAASGSGSGTGAGTACVRLATSCQSGDDAVWSNVAQPVIRSVCDHVAAPIGQQGDVRDARELGRRGRTIGKPAALTIGKPAALTLCLVATEHADLARVGHRRDRRRPSDHTPPGTVRCRAGTARCCPVRC
eukprot:1347267-Prymnesium_polylepis.1